MRQNKTKIEQTKRAKRAKSLARSIPTVEYFPIRRQNNVDNHNTG